MDKMKFWALLPAGAEKTKKLVVAENWGIQESEILEKALAPGQFIARVHSEENFVEQTTTYYLTVLDHFKSDIGTLEISHNNTTGEYKLIDNSGIAVADLYLPAIEFLEVYSEPNEAEFDVEGDEYKNDLNF